MNRHFQTKTLVRLVLVVLVAGIATTLLSGPKDAVADGYGVSAGADPWHNPSLIEGRSVSTLPSLR